MKTLITKRIHWTARSGSVYIAGVTDAPPVMRDVRLRTDESKTMATNSREVQGRKGGRRVALCIATMRSTEWRPRPPARKFGHPKGAAIGELIVGPKSPVDLLSIDSQENV